MAAARCVDCGAEAIKVNGTVVIHHLGSDCDKEEPPALVMRELVGIRDIPVEMAWRDLRAAFAGNDPLGVEVHIQAKYPLGEEIFYIEVRGVAIDASDLDQEDVEHLNTERIFLRVEFLPEALQVFAYPEDESDEIPDSSRCIDISALWMASSFPIIHVDTTDGVLHVLHRPSELAPVISSAKETPF